MSQKREKPPGYGKSCEYKKKLLNTANSKSCKNCKLYKKYKNRVSGNKNKGPEISKREKRKQNSKKKNDSSLKIQIK